MAFTLIGHVGWDGPNGPGRAAGALQRRLLALLLLRANRPVSEQQLIEALWGEVPPTTARRTLHAHLSRLRRTLAATGVDATVLRRDGGYELRVKPEGVDVLRFEALVAAAASALACVSGGAEAPRDHAEAAVAQLEAALRLSDGDPLPGCHGTPMLDEEITRLRELRASASEMMIEALQAMGRHGETIPELERLTAAYPLRERLWWLLMLALYSRGRQADALAAYARARAHLVEELGLEPGPDLRRLQRAVLTQDPELIGAYPADRRGPQSGLGGLQRRKLEHMFRCIDSDGDGVIRREDFERHAAALAAIRGAAPGSDEAEAVRGPLITWWDRIREALGPGGNSGERCELAAWLRFWSAWLSAIMADAAVGGGPALEQMKATTLATVEAIDVDRDGHVSAAEYHAWRGSWGVEVDSRPSFERMDEDGDGLLCTVQVVRLLKEFFLTNDPEAPGNHLYGSPFEDTRTDRRSA